MPRSLRFHGFTLIEVISVVAIVAIVAAILFPVLSRAKDSAGNAVLTSNLHQISVAWTMYDSEDHDRTPSVTRLYSAGLIHNDVLHSPKDPFPLGEGTMTRLCYAKLLKTCGGTRDHLDLAGPSRSSVLSYGDLDGVPLRSGADAYSTEDARRDGATNVGYFAIFTTYPRTTLPLYFGGRPSGTSLLRALPEGSVVTRRLIGTPTNDPNGPEAVHSGSIFFDKREWP